MMPPLGLRGTSGLGPPAWQDMCHLGRHPLYVSSLPPRIAPTQTIRSFKSKAIACIDEGSRPTDTPPPLCQLLIGREPTCTKEASPGS